ncbi:aminotransferase class I/II-fold pyridoxal phosphate-dependent enzyme [Paenibacillus sp. LMG 31460]|uniref:Aminotransferase class I/II-fold pyridoxal phosphate-dependent enzyme n=1 Tax=Paenibacillus germinis TaxID=2654979 RepID=A0ABX1ZCX3_9BACL|nr:DegT/DnrJ/EryC1/StrS aminotransferase family protein [Paenibacillus germinis]NOU90927.1 aminotransferase class I/II-fold pyridoxal phosphate-dependent enzyme [Paenibacillus germinis]
MNSKHIPVLQPSIGQEEIDAVVEVMRSGWLGLGPKTEQFEQEFAKYVGSRFMVALNSGTAALHLALEVLNIGPGDEVIVPPITFISTIHAVSYVGATPVFADVETDTMNISVQDIERKITNKTKAIIVVHLAGHPCDMDAIQALADSKGIKVIEDAAHACGAEYKGNKIGSSGNLTCFSYHAVKNLTCGEGGGITTNQEWIARKLKEKRWVGISKDTWMRSTSERVYAWQYFVDQVGYKYHMSDMQAAIGIVQLKRLDQLNGRRREVAEHYQEHFKDLSWVELPKEKDYARSSWHLFQIKLQTEDARDRLIGHMKDLNIAPGVHYYPCHLHPCYIHLKAEVPVSNEIWKRIITLPIHPNLTDEDLERVVECVRGFQP